MTAHRVGIMGGTFDPVHLGHLIAASEVARLYDLESVLFSPVSRPWHKQMRGLAPAADRVAMLELALADEPMFSVTTVDIDRGGDTYTIDTLDDLDAQFNASHPGEGVEWYFITGADAIAAFDSWKSTDELLRRAHFIGVSRPGHELRLPDVGGAERIELVDVDAADISSTHVRELASREESLDGQVHPAVATYINEHGLYRSPQS
jgi:nicotinate-nucleotide adenylyltransferase